MDASRKPAKPKAATGVDTPVSFSLDKIFTRIDISDARREPRLASVEASGSGRSTYRAVWKSVAPRLNKTPLELEDYFKILERTMDHPTVKPKFRYSTYLKHSAAFATTPLRPYDSLRSCSSLSSASRPKIPVDRSFPSMARRIAEALEAEQVVLTHLTKSCHLVTCTQGCICTSQYLQLILQALKKYVSRGRKLKSLNREEHDYGLEQLGGFCKEIHGIAANALLGTRTFTATASCGFTVIMELLKDHNALSMLLCKTLYTKFPTEDTIANARIKIQACLDSVIHAYEKIGRSGFYGNWTCSQRCNPDVISPLEMETTVIAMMNAFVCLSSTAADLVEVFRILVHSDNVEKTYLLKHVRTFPSEDQKKVFDTIENLRDKIREIHHLLRLIILATEKAMKLFLPPPRPPPELLPFVGYHPWFSDTLAQDPIEESWLYDKNGIPFHNEDTVWLDEFSAQSSPSPLKAQVSQESLTGYEDDDESGDQFHPINSVDNLPIPPRRISSAGSYFPGFASIINRPNSVPVNKNGRPYSVFTN